MKKFVLFFLAIGLLIPLFAVPTSAASYDLGTPRNFYYTTAVNQDYPNWKLATQYSYDYDNSTFSYKTLSQISTKTGFRYFLSYQEYRNNNPLWFLGDEVTSTDVGRNILTSGTDEDAPVLLFGTTMDMDATLFFASFAYENLFLPSSGQYLHVSFSCRSPLINAPYEISTLLDPLYLCYLTDTSGRAGYNDRYALPKVGADTVTLEKVGNTWRYNFFFNLNSVEVASLADSSNVCLCIRMPFYFNRASFSNGVRIITNATFPASYEILTVGGYDQALQDIRNSLDSLKTDIIDFYTDQSSADVGYISRGQAINTQVTNSIHEYNEALKPLDSLRDDYSAPPAAQQVQQQLSNMDTDEVKRFFSVPWIVSALGLVFTFSVIRLILYGTKEG